MSHHHDILADFAPVFAVGLFLFLAFVIAAWSAIARNWFAVLGACGVFALIIVFGKAAFEADGAAILASGLARGGAGIGAGIVKIAPWIAGASALIGFGLVAMHLADKIPAVAFVVLGIVSIAAIAITAGMIWAQTANLLVFGAVATVLSLIGLCVWLSIVLSRHDLARLEALTRHREAEFLPRPTDATAARLAAPPKRLEVHHGNLPAKQNPFRDWR